MGSFGAPGRNSVISFDMRASLVGFKLLRSLAYNGSGPAPGRIGAGPEGKECALMNSISRYCLGCKWFTVFLLW